ncbi:ATP-dependent protease [Bacillus phage vB_BcoS-136]|uniref:ATP-dependent Clp protease proteolytic subunit 2 n=1 Tax=Bacillus phage vB_BcoS-136 TaxID=2419619 RepID=A0A3G3BVL1_9CAUD|nr:ATP-dependent protease [Bacillus phage vB_BcoS-136]AYP68287.1 ATP-dependent Clp protease proteolytic subunit 2 [Bacillus phage vB_BcoS-136]
MLGMPLEPSRKIVISTGINNEVASEVIARIIEINDLDAERAGALTNYQPEPIEIFINSGGGSATDGFAIIGAMEMCDTPIITYGLGIVASMALGIFVKGDVKIAHRYTRFMWHTVGYGAMGYIKDHEDSHKEADILQRMYNDLFKDTKITKDMINDIREKKSDFFFSGKEAVKLGVADEVLLKPEKKYGLMTEEEFSKLQ